MITVLITENEEKLKELLARVLGKEGLSVSGGISFSGPGASADSRGGESFIEIGNAFFSGKKGELYKEIVGTIEKQLIERVLERTEGNQLKAARMLGINRNTIRSKIKKLGIDAKKWKIQ